MSKEIIIVGLGRSSKWLLHELSNSPGEVKITAFDLVLPTWTHDVGNVKFTQIDSLDKIEPLENGGLVISLLPPSEHIYAAQIALANNCNFLTASYLSSEMAELSENFALKNLFSIHEAGLDPGIDHITALEAIDRFESEGFELRHFESHCGGLPALSNLNKWGYSFFWSPLNVLNAGRAGADFLLDEKKTHRTHKELFKKSGTLNVHDIGSFDYYPNRDSLSYLPLYKALHAHTFIRGTLRYPGFNLFWHSLIEAGLISEVPLPRDYTTYNDLKRMLPQSAIAAHQLFNGWEDKPLDKADTFSGAIFKVLLDKLSPNPTDVDRVVMYHNMVGVSATEEMHYQFTLDVEGTQLFSAMSKTVGLPLKLICDLYIQNHLFKPGCYTVADGDLRQILHPMLMKMGLPIKEKYTRFELRQH